MTEETDPLEAPDTEIGEALAKARGGIRLGQYEWAAKQDPEFMKGYEAFTSLVWDPPYERALDPKTRALIAIVLFAFRGIEDTLPRHMQRAMKLGASKQEILEALETACLPGGGPTLYRGITALMKLEELEEQAADE